MTGAELGAVRMVLGRNVDEGAVVDDGVATFELNEQIGTQDPKSDVGMVQD